MCGFLAVLQDAPTIDLGQARRALDAIAHRGPDAKGEWSEDDVFLGHRRLSIIDLATGDQPMHSSDGRYVIVFNGEIYNFRDLGERLTRDGWTLRTQSDTEVILEGYRRWGPRIVNLLNGMFAFVIWDRQARSAFAARDRLGIKPLCWAVHRGALVVSSTLEPVIGLNGFGTINPVAVRDLMTFDYIPTPRTILRGVHKLDPGSRFEWMPGADTPRIERYWSPPTMSATATPPDEWELESLLDQAVKRQLISDVPLGAFLSGGIDSSLLTAFMARHSSRPVRTFSVAFEDNGLDESPIAALVARRFGTDHTVLRARPPTPEGLLELLGRLDEPLCDPAVVPTYALSALTRDHVKVAISGDGGDEVFGGYPKYLIGEPEWRPAPLSSIFDRTLRSVPWRPRGMASVYWRLLSSQERVRFAWARHGDFPVFGKDLRQLLTAEYHDTTEVDAFFEPWERRARRHGDCFDSDVLMRADLETYLSENCLVKTDRASMLASLEVRVPFLDELVVDRIVPLPVTAKIHNRQLKALLMPIARRLLPSEVWDRPKQGFGGPLDAWLAGMWRPAVDTMLEWGQSNLPIFNYHYLHRLHALNCAKRNCGRVLWNPFVFLAWAKANSVTL
jgi:asparagine synthase (glutamine-hydrolysing)